MLPRPHLRGLGPPFPYNLCWLIAPWRSPFPCEVCHPQPSMLLSMEAWKRQVFCSITS